MIYITGFPHTGTSFLAEVVLRFGLNFGDPSNLKGITNTMNRHGHFEHVPIRNLIWDDIEKFNEDETLNPCDPRTYRVQDPNPIIVAQVENIIDREQVQVYKDTFYPILHKYLPPPNLILATYRDPHQVYLAPIIGNLHDAVCNSGARLKKSMGLWYSTLAKEYPTDIVRAVNYDSLFNPDSFRAQMQLISEWLDVRMDEEMFRSCEQAWYPQQMSKGR